MTKQEILNKFNDIDFVYNDSSRLDTLSRMIDELLGEQQKKVIMVHKKHSIIFDRDAPFSIGGVYQIIAETLIDSGELVIDRTDDGTKVEFVWHLETEREHR